MRERATYLPPEARGETLEKEFLKKIESGNLFSRERSKWKHFTPEFVGTQSQTLNIGRVFRQISLAVKGYEESRLSQAEGYVKIDTAYPIAITHLGDLHLGSVYTNHREILRKIDQIKKTPNMYVVFMANLIDNAIPSQFPSNMLVNVIPPDRQVAVMRRLVQDLDRMGKVIGAVTSPCHEGWSWKHTGQDINDLIFGYSGRKFPILENGGLLHIKVGNQPYIGALYHQVGPYESNFNETHALRQLNRLTLNMKADWVAGAHKHFAAAQEVYEGTGKYRKLVVYIRTGTEKGTGKIHDQWAKERYGNTGEPTGQTVFLWPGHRKLAAECHFDTAVLAQEAYYVRAAVEKKRQT